jgi:hypothetical protein
MAGVAALLALASAAVVRWPATEAAAADPPSQAASGELVYVPIYSSIFYETGRRTLELAATLAIHNVNPDRPITIARADYYNTSGALVKRYADKPITLGPLQTTTIVVEKSDVAGGPGANFLVEWQANGESNSPRVEAIMINATSNLGIAFTSPGTVVKRLTPAK